jgi:hypothetical protein
MGFYWNADDRKDQEFRRTAYKGRVYTDDARCDWCRDRLEGSGSECSFCGALLCAIHSCVDGRCPEHTAPGAIREN